MTALAIFLLVLKIIGIILLSVLGLLFFVFLIVLFVPLRYYAKGGYSDQTGKGLFLVAKGSWLLHIFRVKYEFGLKEPLSFKILWIDLLKKKEKKEKKRKKADDLPDFEDEDEGEDDVHQAISQASDDLKPESAPEPEKTPGPEKTPEPEGHDAPSSEAKEESDPDPNIVIIEDEPAFGSKRPDTASDQKEAEPEEPIQKEKRKKTTQDKGKYDKIKRYVEILKSERFQRAFTLAKDSIFKILKSVLPRKWKIEATLGFEDPSTLGTILGINGMFYPVLHKHLLIHDVWDRQVIEAEGSLKGHITLGKLAFIALRVYFNKDVRKIIKLFKEA